MKRQTFGLWAAVLTGAVVLVISGLVAEARQEPRQERVRPRMLMLDGRGPQLGVSVQDLDAEGLKAAAGAASGVRVDDVDQESPAAKAGVREGDIIVEVDGDRVRSARQFARVVQETADGRSLRLGIVRNGQRQTVEVTPESRALGFGVDGDRIGRDIARGLREIEPRLREIEPRLREIEPRLREFRFDGPMTFDFDRLPRFTSPRGRLGIQLGDLTPQLAEYFGVKDGGVLVSAVTVDSAAAKAGLKAGDVITSVNGDRVRDAEDVIDELAGVERGEVTLGIVRDKKETTVKATIEPVTPRRPGRPI